MQKKHPIYKRVKRLLDIFASLIALILFSPLLAYISYKVKKNLGSPVIFSQMRPGLDEKNFKIYKFRTMKDATDQNGNPLPDFQRLTPFGNRLRSTSLDELPELLNVLKGDMSIVGPRPLLVEFLPLYSQQEALRHSVRPGITGLAQVNGRNAMTWDRRLELDLQYVNHMSLLLDLKIIWQTIKTIIKKDGINSGTKETIITPPTTIKRPHLLNTKPGGTKNERT